jgi:uncharacterized phage infection (PIP) family protein YhgE
LLASTKFNILGASIGKVLGLSVTSFFAGWQIGTLINELTGLERWLNKIAAFAKDSETTIGQVYEKDAIRMNQAATAAHDLAMKIGAVEEARMLEASVAANNAQVTSRTIRLINELAAAYNKAHIEVDGLTGAEEEQTRKQKQREEAERMAAEARDKYNAELRETYDLLTGEEVLENLKQLVREERELTAQGIDRKSVHEAMIDKLVEQLEWAKKYNLELPQGVHEIAKAMEKEALPQTEKWGELFERTFEHVNAQPGKIIEGMVKVGDSIATELKGGFGRGFKEGTDQWTAYDAQLQNALNATLRGGFGKGFDGFRTEVQNIVDEMNATPMEVAIIPNKDIWIQFFYDLANGRYPDTGG